ncbi:MAG: uracil-DNA glycosylase family protein [Pseudomonadota bacterium]
MDLLTITDRLVRELDHLSFSAPVTHVYNPLVYARGNWDTYLQRFGAGPREAVLLGMNPGPWGMAQTGVPFGDASFVRRWLEIDGPVDRPEDEHPKRPVRGLDCPRGEVSGQRVWGWAEARFGTPEAFFGRFFVANYCPLSFMEESGRNRTPDKLPRAERDALFDACDRALRRSVEVLAPEVVVGVGRFAEDRARAALAGIDVRIARAPHPSPASPLANQGWAPLMDAALEAAGFTGSRLP